MQLDATLFPDVDQKDPPQSVTDWTKHYCHRGDEGAIRLRDLLRALIERGHERAQRKYLQEYFSQTEPRITEDQIDKFLYQPKPPRLGPERLELIVRYLWDQDLLPRGELQQRKPAADILRDLHDGLAGFLDVASSSMIELEERLPGVYWIYSPSSRDPGKYVRGLLTVKSEGSGLPLTVCEDYRVPGNPAAGEHELREAYEGLALQKSHRPFMLSSLKVPTQRSKPKGELQDADVAVLRVTLIAATQVHADGKIASMVGLAASTYFGSGVLASPVCFERIPPAYPGKPDQELKLLTAEQLPSSVLARLANFAPIHGLLRM